MKSSGGYQDREAIEAVIAKARRERDAAVGQGMADLGELLGGLTIAIGKWTKRFFQAKGETVS